MRTFAFALAALVCAIIALAAGLAGAACQNAGELCKVGVTCCAGLVCTPRPGQGSICTGTATVTTTLPAPGATTTTSTKPSASTTTTTLPVSGQVRLSPCHLGLRSTSPNDRRYDPRTGQPGNQYLARVQAEQKIHELMPRGIRIMRNTPACAGRMTSVTENARINVPSRLFWRYGIRTLRGGGPYPFTVADYNHNYPETFFETFCGCVPVASMTPEWRQVCSTPTNNLGDCPAIQPKRPGAMSGAGTLAPNKPGPPLTPSQCTALSVAVKAHHEKSPETRAKITAFVNTATTVDQLALFDLFFVADTDPLHTPAAAEAHTQRTMVAMDEWQAAFQCGTGLSPIVERVNTTSWRHARAHWHRATAGLTLAIICDGQIDQCGESGW